MADQVILSAAEACAIYNRLDAAEAEAAKAVALYAALKEENKPKANYTIDFVGDQGIIGAAQNALAERIYADDPHLLLLAGDNTYTNPATCEEIIADQMVFHGLKSECRVYRALGNHDLDVEPLGECSYDYYDYLPGNRRYYTRYFPGVDLQLFVINDGGNSIDHIQEPDGYQKGSIQHDWFVREATKSTAKWRVLMFHHPIFSQQSGAIDVHSYYRHMDWDFERYGMDLVINGHNHLNVHHELRGLDYVQLSGPVQPIRLTRTGTDVPYGDPGPVLIYKDNTAGPHLGTPAYGRLQITPKQMTVEFVSIFTGEPYYCFPIENCRESTDPCLPPTDYCEPCNLV